MLKVSPICLKLRNSIGEKGKLRIDNCTSNKVYSVVRANLSKYLTFNGEAYSDAWIPGKSYIEIVVQCVKKVPKNEAPIKIGVFTKDKENTRWVAVEFDGKEDEEEANPVENQFETKGQESTSEERSRSNLLKIECPICYENFNHDELKPRILKCGHTVCEACAKNLSKTTKGVHIECPFDRKITEVKYDIENLPKNFTLLDILDQMKPKNSEEASANAEQYPKCTTHPKQLALFICTSSDCKLKNKWMCQLCMIANGPHASHTYTSSNKALEFQEKAKRKLDELYKELENLKETEDNVEVDTRKIDDRHRDEVRIIEQKYMKKIQEIELEKKANVRKLNEKHEAEKHRLRTKKEGIESERLKVKKLMKLIADRLISNEVNEEFINSLQNGR